MPQPKPIAYPNILDQLKAVTAAHQAVHAETTNHAAAHRAKLDAKRTLLKSNQMAKKLTDGDGKS